MQRIFLLNPTFNKQTLSEIKDYLAMRTETCIIFDISDTGLKIRETLQGTLILTQDEKLRHMCYYPYYSPIKGHTHVRDIVVRNPHKFLYPSVEDIVSTLKSDINVVQYVFIPMGYWVILNESFFLENPESHVELSTIIRDVSIELKKIFELNLFYKKIASTILIDILQ